MKSKLINVSFLGMVVLTFTFGCASTGSSRKSSYTTYLLEKSSNNPITGFQETTYNIKLNPKTLEYIGIKSVRVTPRPMENTPSLSVTMTTIYRGSYVYEKNTLSFTIVSKLFQTHSTIGKLPDEYTEYSAPIIEQYEVSFFDEASLTISKTHNIKNSKEYQFQLGTYKIFKE